MTRSRSSWAAGADGPIYGMVAPLAPEQRSELYGTTKPTRKMIEEGGRLWERLDRGFGTYVVAYDRERRPSELDFAGYSFD